nr:hypothetical protein BSM_02070 [uncultured archaeon]
MPRNLFRVWCVPRSLIAQRVKIPSVLFTRIGAEANSGRVSLARGNLKSLRLSLARSTSEPVVGYAKRRPSCTLGKFNASMGWYTVRKCGPKRVCHRGSACLIRVGMKTKGWLGDRGRSRIVLERGKEGIT